MPGYGSPWARLVATIDGDECWRGNNGLRCRGGYHRLHFYIPGLARRVHLSAHVCTWVCAQLRPGTPWDVGADEMYLAYLEVRESGLEIDHECNDPSCRNPAHLGPVTHVENCRLRERRRRESAPVYTPTEDEMKEVEF